MLKKMTPGSDEYFNCRLICCIRLFVLTMQAMNVGNDNGTKFSLSRGQRPTEIKLFSLSLGVRPCMCVSGCLCTRV